MGCCGAKSASTPRGIREETLIRIPGASVHLMADCEAVELAKGDLTIVRITNNDVMVATVVRIGRDLGWPLTKDEPVVKLDQLHYLFTLADKEGGFLNYGVSFTVVDGRLASLDMFLKENACFSTPSANTSSSLRDKPSSDGYWKECAPRVEGYNSVLAKAIAKGTGEIVRGIFMCSNAYASQIQKGADLFRPQAIGNTTNGYAGMGSGAPSHNANAKQGGINKSLRRVRKLSEMTENMSQSLLDIVISVTGTFAAPLLRSKPGRSFLAMVPGEVLLASLDAINNVMDAVEAAEKRSLAATSGVVAGAVSRRFGESAGEATEDAFATAGHAVGTAWNIFKIRKAIKPSSSLPSSMLKNAVRNRN